MRSSQSFRPTKQQLIEARDKVVPDLIKPGLKVLFCGINPGLYSGATGHHFARPGNRFWPALHQGGFTPRVLSAFEEGELLKWGYGITNVVQRATATAAEIEPQEYVNGARRLRRRVLKYRPRVLAVLGIGAYRAGFGRQTAHIGLEEATIGQTRIWILPNPSGLNAHYTLARLGGLFAELKAFADSLAEA